MFKAKKLLIFILVSLFLFPVFAIAVNYSDGSLLRAEGDIKVYLVNNNIKRWVSSLEVFNLNNFRWPDVRVVSKKEVTSIKEGEPIIVEPTPASSASPTPLISITPTPRPSPKATEDKTPIPAKINDMLPPPDYIRVDWLVSHATSNYGRVGQKITFKYSDKEKDKIENFRLYEKKPGDLYFSKIAEFEEVPSTGCEDIDIDGEWMMTEAGQCGYWSVQRVTPPGGRGMTAYLPKADYSVGEYTYYVAGVDKDRKETPASPEARMVFLNPVSILNPVDGQPINGVYPDFRWTIAGGPLNGDTGWPIDSTVDYFLMISGDNNALNPIWTKQLKILSGETERQFFYDGFGLDPTKKYKVNIYGHYRKSEYDPDYVSIPFSVPEFWIKSFSWTSLFKMTFASIFRLFVF